MAKQEGRSHYDAWIRADSGTATRRADELLPPRFARYIKEEIAVLYGLKPATVRDESLRARKLFTEQLGLTIPGNIRRLRVEEAKNLIQQVRLGDRSAAIRLVALWPGTVGSFIRNMDEGKKEDFILKVVERVQNSGAKIRWEGLSKLNRWLKISMRGVAVDLYNSEQIPGSFEADVFDWMDKHPDVARGFIDELSSWQREVIVLVRSGLSYEEIQLRYPSKSHSSIRKTFYKARRSLEEKIDSMSGSSDTTFVETARSEE